MSLDADVTLNLSGLDLAADKVRAGLSKGLRAVGFAIEEQAKHNVEAVDAIDTGMLRSSIYTQIEGEDGRPGAIASAKAAADTEGKHSHEKGEFEEAEPEIEVSGDLEVKVGVAAAHGLPVELGTISVGSHGGDEWGASKMQARPYLHPAVETVQGKAQEAIGKYIAEEVA